MGFPCISLSYTVDFAVDSKCALVKGPLWALLYVNIILHTCILLILLNESNVVCVQVIRSHCNFNLSVKNSVDKVIIHYANVFD